MRKPISIEDLRNSKCAVLNPHLFDKELPKKGKSKYGNAKTEVAGIEFDSKREAKRYKELKILLKAGDIGMLEMQKRYELVVNEKIIAVYYSDFDYIRKDGTPVTEDVKSPFTRKLPIYRLKKKLMKQIYNIEITEI